MNHDDAAKLITGLLGTFTGMEPESITGDLRVVDDLGIESIDAVELLIAVERDTGLRFEVEHLDELGTVDELIDGLVSMANGLPGATSAGAVS